MTKRELGALTLAVLMVTAGCGESQSSAPAPAEVPTPGDGVNLGDPGPLPAGQSEPAPEGGATSPAPATTDAAPAGEVTLQVSNWAGVQQLVAAHQGKVVVVDVWSTSCPPCMAEFPQLVKLQHELGEFVACISVSADYDGIPSKPPETYREQVLAFLTKQQATFENVLCSEYVYDVLGIGSIPAVYIYDQKGRQVKVFADPADGQEFTYEKNIRPFVQSLLVSQ